MALSRCWPAGKTAHQSTATMVYIFCLMGDGLGLDFSVASGQSGGAVGW